ncbi:MAG TPA: glutathione S-transferase N-terminal domain-containing protein [Alcaligenes sp.]|nr:glutathione S-transferase N-terminal domain-containing protein [Alcaligenes faecalis]HRL20318.1 glutathione S-transferase N-terminal domain-containing protein [Alcaligenes sp.]
MKLYYLPGACPLACHIALEWIGKPYDIHAVSRDELKQPAFLAMNPLGAVPVLQDEGMTLTQSSAILEYLAEKNPEANLLGKTLQERAQTRRWLAFVNADIHRNFGVMFGVQRYADQEATQAEVRAKTGEIIQKLFSLADQQLADRQWLTGTRSVADAYLYVVMRWAHIMKIDLSGQTHLNAFFTRMEQDPAVQAALRAEGLSKE